MNLKEIKDLINLMNENNLSELEIEKDGTRIRLRKSASGQFEAITEENGSPKITQTIRAQEETPARKEEKESSSLVAVKSPMVGTFYRAASPDSKPYAEIGQIIDIGQVICIVEAMKLMNEIKSEVKGRVVEILAENAEPVEYGQVLFMVEPL